jgi:hypothetical protein
MRTGMTSNGSVGDSVLARRSVDLRIKISS